jgi:hypothetical protein
LFAQLGWLGITAHLEPTCALASAKSDKLTSSKTVTTSRDLFIFDRLMPS